MTEVAYRAQTRLGFETTLAYSGVSYPLGRGGRIGRFWTRVKRLRTFGSVDYAGMPAVEIPTLPGFFSRALQARWFAWRLRPLLKQYDRIIVIGATSHLAMALLDTKMPFLCWIAITLRDELESRVAGGDTAAQSRLNSKLWAVEEKQEQICLTGAPLVLTISEYTEKCVRTIAPQANVRTLPVPVDTNIFHPGNRGTIHNKPPTIVFAGRYSDPRKNTPLLFKAVRDVLEQIDVDLLLIGDEPTPELIRICEEYGISNRVKFMERLPRLEDVAEWYRKSTLFALPSRQEGLAIVVLEAMACGLPIVSTRCGGPEAILEASGAGILTDHTPASFSHAILTMLSDEAKYQAMSKAAIAYTRSKLSFAVFDARFKAAQEEVFGKEYP